MRQCDENPFNVSPLLIKVILTGSMILAMANALVAPASAALPEFQRAGVGVGAGITFKGTGEAPIEIAKADTNIKCTAEANENGATTGPTVVAKVVLKFTGCEKEVAEKCKTPGSAAGTIVTNNLTGKLGYLEKAGKKVGLLYAPEKAGPITQYKCEAEILTKNLNGSVIGEVKEVNKEQEPWEAIFKKVGAPLVQEWTSFEKEVEKHELSTTCFGIFNPTAVLIVKEKLKWEKPVEIKA